MSRADAIAEAVRYFDDGGFARDLARRVAVPTESQEPAHAADLSAYLATEITPTLRSLGFSCRIVANPRAGGPFLIASRYESPELPTVLGYGHGDVVRGMDGKWSDGRSPWEMRREHGRLYGRGTADNKGQHGVAFGALAAVLAARGGRLRWNAKFLMEMGEEVGSPGLREICAAEKEALRADVLIASDGPRLSAGDPTLFLGSRGAITFDLRVDLRSAAYHSGNWGGLLANPAIILAHAIAALVGPRGQITVEALRAPQIPPSVRAALADCVITGDEAPVTIDRWWGEPGLSPAEKVFGWNSFEVLAMSSGTPEKPVSAIPSAAFARCQLRFVVGTNKDDVLRAVRIRLKTLGLDTVTVTEAPEAQFVATRLDPENIWVKFAAASIARTVGRPPAILPNHGGSLPNDAFSEILGLPTIWVPHSHPACQQHAPDEHLLETIAREGLAITAGLYWDLGESSQQPQPRFAAASSSAHGVANS
jgi:acetylornithine deacetylase/succinyl-diaminopimelate desuccinylase-like protein